MNATDYTAQAQAWADTYGVRMTATFTGHRKYFDGDADTRDVYSIVLTRGNKSMTFDFGTYLNDSRLCDYSKGPYWDKLRRDRERGDGRIFHRQHNVLKAPTLYDVIACVEKSEVGTFEQWCGDFGYDTDSRRALETYLIVQKQYADFLRLCGGNAEMLAAAQEIA